MNNQNFETFFLFFLIKLNIYRVVLLARYFPKKKKLQQNLDGKLLKVGKKVILVVDPHKTNYNLSLKVCENIVKVVLR